MRSVFRNREFRLLFIGQSASTIGDRLVFVALALYVDEIGSPSDVGLVLGVQALGLVTMLLLGGVWADRLPRQRVMLATDFVRAGLHALLAALIFAGVVEVWHIIVIEAAFGAAEAFFRPAFTGLLPQTVPEDQIQQASATSGIMNNTAEFVGPALATALVVGLGAGAAFTLDAATFVVSALFLMRMRPRPRGEQVARRALLAELRDGWAEVRSRDWVFGTIGFTSLSLLFGLAPYFTLGPSIAEEVYGERGVYGLLAAILGAGTLFGAVLGLRWRPLYPMRAAYLCALPWPVAIALFALGIPLPLAALLFFLTGNGFALFIVWWETALAERIPPHLLSRVSSFDWMGSLALMPLGYIAAGPLGEALGGVEVLVVGCALALAADVAGLSVPGTWRLRRLSEPPAHHPDGAARS